MMATKQTDLAALLGALPEEEVQECAVDVSEWLGNDPETGEPVKFVFREPDLSKLYIAHDDAPKIRARVPDWSQRMCLTVGYMIQAHVSPPVKTGDSKGLLYIEMAQKHPHLFERLWERVMDAFSTAGGIEEDAKAREGECATPPEAPS